MSDSKILLLAGLALGYVMLTRRAASPYGTAPRQVMVTNQNPDYWLKMAGIQVAGSAIRDIATAAMAPSRATQAVATSDGFGSYTNLITDYNGWSYYDNGTAISPDGSYYFEGQQVWSPN